MKILWVPHTSRSRSGVRSRSAYFIDRLAGAHTIHEVCWDVPIRRSPVGLASTLRRWTRVAGKITFHHLPRLPTFPGPLGALSFALNQGMFSSAIRRIVREYPLDVVVCSCNWYALGFPPRDLPVSVVLDYFDFLSDEHEARYFSGCQAVLCASSVMYDRARRHAVAAFHLPNGVDSRLFRQADGAAARRRYGLEDARVVSLIGLTASEDLYFLDAIERVARRFPDVRGLIVGGGTLLPAIQAKIRGREQLFTLLGPRPYEEMPELFACSDVGLYPGDSGPQFQAALPIKVLEYGAAGKPVVSVPLEELRRLAFPNVVFAAPTAADFADAIGGALSEPSMPPDLAPFELDRLAGRLVEILEDVVSVPAGITREREVR